MIKNSSHSIVWLEDNAYEDDSIDIMNHIECMYKLRLASGVYSLRMELDESKEQSESIKGVILDMMIHGLKDLNSFDRPDIKWSTGSRVGELILKYVFRGNDARWKYLNDAPVLILSAKSDVLQHDFIEYGEKITIIQKYDGEFWMDEVKKWIKSL